MSKKLSFCPFLKSVQCKQCQSEAELCPSSAALHSGSAALSDYTRRINQVTKRVAAFVVLLLKMPC